MPTWPMAADYTMMLQNPKVAFKDPELRTATIARDANGQPFGMAGAFAVVYHATLPDGRNKAVRAFTSARDGRAECYRAISEYLGARKNLQAVVGFEYHEKGIRAGDGKMYPLVTMEWVPGCTLYEWVRQECQKRNDAALRQAADRWKTLVDELADAKIAHGDLQHANVLVTNKGELKLVDYDCMCVPELAGRRNLEIGVEPYQHPGRNADTLLSPTLDNFSAIFIFVVLRALAAAPKLWDTYIEHDRYDKLLIRRTDFETPTQSSLYKELMRSPDSDVGRVSKELFELFHADIGAVPSLRDVLFSWERVRSLLTQRQFDDAVKLVDSRGRANGTPANLQQLIREAYERVRCLKALQEKLQLGDEAGMKQLYNPKLLSNYPAASEAASIAQHAARVLELLDQLRNAKQRQAWRDFVRIWDANQQLLDSRKSAQAFKTDVAMWRQRNQACDALLALVKRPGSDVQQLARAWGDLLKLGGHPEAEPHRAQIEKSIERDRAWRLFQQVPGTISEDSDNKLLTAWNEVLFAGWNEAERERPRVQQAKQRLTLVAQLQQASQHSPQAPTIDGEKSLIDLAARLPGNYQYALAARVQTAHARLVAVDQLRQSLAEPASEAAIVAAAQKLGGLQGQMLLDPQSEARVRLAQQRVPLLNALKQISPNLPLDQLDQQLLARWRDDVLRDCHEAQPWRPAYAIAVKRKEVLGRLRVAVDKKDELAIGKLMEEPCLRGYPLPRDWSRAVTDAQERIQRGEKLVAALRSNNHALFLEQFDQHLIEQSGSQFLPFRNSLVEWIKQDILPREKLGLKPSLAAGSLVGRPSGDYRVRWIWPQPRFTDQCILAVCRHKPKLGDDPRAMDVIRYPITRDRYQAASGCVIHPSDEWDGYYVAVWAVINVGFETFVSEPLILGRLGVGQNRTPGKTPQRRRRF